MPQSISMNLFVLSLFSGRSQNAFEMAQYIILPLPWLILTIQSFKQIILGGRGGRRAILLANARLVSLCHLHKSGFALILMALLVLISMLFDFSENIFPCRLLHHIWVTKMVRGVAFLQSLISWVKILKPECQVNFTDYFANI